MGVAWIHTAQAEIKYSSKLECDAAISSNGRKKWERKIWEERQEPQYSLSVELSSDRYDGAKKEKET